VEPAGRGGARHLRRAASDGGVTCQRSARAAVVDLRARSGGHTRSRAVTPRRRAARAST
jgi:hypothetical protein